MLFLALACAIAGATWWHFSRTPVGTSGGDAEGGIALAAPQEWTPEQLRQTRGEIVIGGNTPTKSGLETPGQVASLPPETASPQKQSSEKPEEILAKNAPTTPAAAAAPTLVLGEENYTVQKGDTLGAIAKKKYGSAAPRFVDAIVKKNSLKSADALKIGAKLVLPDPASLKK